MVLDANILRNFFHRSREWSRARRGLELFELASADLKEFADVDTGFFVYRKRILGRGVEPQRPAVYVPWGAFADDANRLQELVEMTLEKMDMIEPMIEQWVATEDLSPKLQTEWKRFRLVEVGVWPIVSKEEMIGAIVVARTENGTEQLDSVTRMAMLDACTAQISLALDLILVGRIAEEASQRDLLTGLLNRRGLESSLEQILSQTRQSGRYVIIGLIDVDNLKTINDSHGHPTGDKALKDVAEVLRRNVRDDDVVARVGGDEFAVVLQTTTADVDFTMTRLRKAVLAQASGKSVSVGGAVWGLDGASFESCYEVADKRLYHCKRSAKRAVYLKRQPDVNL